MSLSPAGRKIQAYALEILSLERQAQNAINETGSYGGTLLVRGVLQDSRYREKLSISILPNHIARVSTRLICHNHTEMKKTVDAFKAAMVTEGEGKLDSLICYCGFIGILYLMQGNYMQDHLRID